MKLKSELGGGLLQVYDIASERVRPRLGTSQNGLDYLRSIATDLDLKHF